MELNKIQKRIKRTDIMVWVSFGLMCVVKFATILLFSIISKESGASIEAVASTYEANWLFKIYMISQNIGYLLMVILLPAAAMAFYYYIRRKAFESKVDISTVEFFVVYVFFMMLLNFVNDIAALIGKVIQIFGG